MRGRCWRCADVSIILPLLRQFWFIPVIAALSGIVWAQSLRLDLAEAEVARYEAQADANMAAIKRIKERSRATAERISHDHAALLTATEKHAAAKYQARYRPAACPVGNGVRLDSLLPGTGLAGSAARVDAAEPVAMAIDERFLTDASKAAVMIHECQQFIINNKLPIRGGDGGTMDDQEGSQLR